MPNNSIAKSIKPCLRRLLLLSGSLLILAGCSAEGFYRSTQLSNQQECRRLPEPQQAHCLSLYDTSYEEYERSREAAVRQDRVEDRD